MKRFFSPSVMLSLVFWFTIGPVNSRFCEAGLGPQNVLVVVNDASWTSKAVANEYIHLRQIPPSNVVYLKDVPVTHQITIEQFRNSILTPILQTIAERGIDPQIECIAYSADFPWKIDLRGDIPKEVNVPKQLTPYGSLTGMTYLFDLVSHKDINYLQLNSNLYVRQRKGATESLQLDATEQRTLQDAFARLKEEDWEQAVKQFDALLESKPESPFLLYHRAVCLSRLKMTDDALAALEKAVEKGLMLDRRLLQQNEHFAALKEEPRYQAIMQKLQSPVFDVTAADSFSHQRPYPVPFRPEPVHYRMSIMLGVTTGRGNSVAEIENSLRRSAQADFTSPAATIYFPKNGDVRSTTREPYFAAAVAQIERAGQHAEIVDGTIPQNRQAVGGVMAGIAGFDWPKSKSELQPGAICEHLTSFGAMFFHNSGQTPISEWIRAGAAGTSGTVHEPYAIQAKFPTAFLHVHYVRGFSLAESFYLSVAAPYQLLILGDPLCTPWGTQPDFSLPFADNQTLTESVPLAPESTDKILRYALLVDGIQFADPLSDLRETLPIEQYADGSHTLSVAAIADSSEQPQRIKHYPFRINRFGKSVELRLDSGTPDTGCAYDSDVSVIAKCEGAERIEIQQNGRILGTIEGASGTVSIPAEVPGIGTSQLYAVAFGTDWSTRSEPLTVNIAAPPLRAASEKTDASTPGLKLTFEEKSAIVETLDKADWLTEAGVTPDQPFVLKGTCTVDRDDLYQLEVSGNIDCRISINGTEVNLPPLDRAFRCVPLSLAAGPHEFEIRGTVKENPRLQILFGNSGRRPLEKQYFSH